MCVIDGVVYLLCAYSLDQFSGSWCNIKIRDDCQSVGLLCFVLSVFYVHIITLFGSASQPIIPLPLPPPPVLLVPISSG